MTAASLDAMRRLELGGGIVEAASARGVRLSVPPKAAGYADAQVDDGAAVPRARFSWRPPLSLRLRARASHPSPTGTLGFGFWNDPFAVSLGQRGAARRLPAGPAALWFFYASPPADLRFTPGIPGAGWKAMQLSTRPIPALGLYTLAPAALVLAQLPPLRAPVMRRALGQVEAAEAMLPGDLSDWHSYELEWREAEAEFRMDGQLRMKTAFPLAGPLCFVAWIDNQFATATPEGGFHFGALPTSEPQWLEIDDFSLSAREGPAFG